MLFSGRDPLGVVAQGGVTLAPDAGWAALELPGMSASVEAPLRSWRVAMTADGGAGFELELEAISAPAPFEAGGMEGYEQLCRVSGIADGRHVECLGQRGHSWGAPDWSEIALARSLGAWLEDGSAVALTAIRPAGTEDHAGEQVWAALLDAEGSVPIADPRLSTTYDGEGHQRRAGLELWVGEGDEHPRRGSGPGPLRLEPRARPAAPGLRLLRLAHGRPRRRRALRRAAPGLSRQLSLPSRSQQ